MQPFIKHTGIVAPLDRANVDTDQIIPKQFLKRIERTGFGQFLFYDWRFDDNNQPRQGFILNQKPYDQASVLLARHNFGCGSSREHAPWALMDFGFRAIIAPSFADIFYNNCFKNGLLPITLPEDVVDSLFQKTVEQPGYQITVDLENRLIQDQDGLSVPFTIDEYKRECLLKGLDDIGVTLQHEDKIADYEKRFPAYYHIK
ncbi:MAG: 3-isopropylmalate dehydratase small subunit [Bacillaceae bacterium]|nr:3-isopropylmalate dehydratase small subunit [Bacillaceae bacterium]